MVLTKAEIDRRYRERHPERIALRAAAYYKANRNKIVVVKRERYAETSKAHVECELCGAHVTPAYMLKHIERKHEHAVAREQCPHCVKTYDVTYLAKHIALKHAAPSTVEV